MVGKINSLTEEQQDDYLENKYGITSVKFTEDVQHHCPLGEQVGVTTYTVEVVPGKRLAELVQLHWDIQEMVGKTYTLETGGANVMEIVKKHYPDAKYISVIASCPPNRHAAVEVEIEYEG